MTDADTTGKVILVGAGPGDPDLLTLKGAAAIEAADVIVYDRLVSPRQLDRARHDCELIYVGKTPDHHTLPQDEINRVLVEQARKGHYVVRLKGGDPNVFGRGSEEALFLREHGIAFEFVPGVTSAIAAAEYAGIPVTHRGLAPSFSVITGHEDPEKLKSQIDWKVLAKQTGTLIFLMGMKNLPVISAGLIDGGMSPDTPVGIVYRGTWPDQRVLTSTLAAVSDDVVAEGFTNPSIIIVGEVVSLQADLAWKAPAPLAGFTVAITRSRAQASRLADLLVDLGANVCEYPMIRIAPPLDAAPLHDAVASFSDADWVVFSSTNGVDAFFAAVEKDGVDPSALTSHALAVGPATARALAAHGITGVAVPERFDAEGIVEALGGRIEPGQRVILIQAEAARDTARRGIEELGADVTAVTAYRSVPVTTGRDDLVAALRDGTIDAMTFTSSSTVSNMVDLLGDDVGLLDGVSLYSIGPVTTSTMTDKGLVVGRQAEQATIESLVAAIVEERTASR